jgi:hypothetical protein
VERVGSFLGAELFRFFGDFSHLDAEEEADDVEDTGGGGFGEAGDLSLDFNLK